MNVLFDTFSLETSHVGQCYNSIETLYRTMILRGIYCGQNFETVLMHGLLNYVHFLWYANIKT